MPKKHSTRPHTAHLKAALPHLHFWAKVYCIEEHLHGLPQFDGIGRSEGGTGKLSKVGKSGHLNIFFYGTSLGLQHCYLKKTPLTQDNECVQELISTTHRRCSSILNHIARWPPPPRFTPRPAVSSRQMWGVRLRHSQIRVSGILIRGFGSRNLYKTLNGECTVVT